MRSREPDSAAVRRPGETCGADEGVCELFHRSIQIDDINGASVILRNSMVQKRDAVALGRNSQVADPTGGFVEHLADRVLELSKAALRSNNRKIRTVGRPVRPIHLVEDLAGCAARERHSRQGAELLKDSRVASKQDSHLTGRGDSHKLGPGISKGSVLGAACPRGINVDGISVPSGAEINRLAIGTKPGRVNSATAEGDLVIDRLRYGSLALREKKSSGKPGGESCGCCNSRNRPEAL